MSQISEGFYGSNTTTFVWQRYYDQNCPCCTYVQVSFHIFVSKLLTREDFGTEWWVGVEDDARLHAIALLDPDVQSERIFACAAPFTWTQIIQTFKELRPDNDKISNPPENEGATLLKVKPSSRAEQLLRKFYGRAGWTSLKENLADGIADI